VLPADPDRTHEAQIRFFDASYKGVTDFVTKWVWPLPARIVTGWCAQLGIAPNTVTALSYLLTIFSLLAFWQGDFTNGLVSAWFMTFFDTVDGKLARVTLTSSKLGDVLDHGLDLIHPPLWWAAWGAGLAGPGMLFGAYEPWVAIAFFGYIVGRLLEGLFILAFGQEMFTWRPFDFGFRLVIARRNPNLVLLTGATLMGRPDLGLIAIASWTLCCILIQCVRIAQAKIFQMRGHEIFPHSE
jgi:phosphatidylglycerophosphate synthase